MYFKNVLFIFYLFVILILIATIIFLGFLFARPYKDSILIVLGICWCFVQITKVFKRIDKL
jgi:hypothetical protein